MFSEIQMHQDPRTSLYRAELIIHGGHYGPVHAYISEAHATEDDCLTEIDAWQERHDSAAEVPNLEEAFCLADDPRPAA
jgi:hypothetical protein